MTGDFAWGFDVKPSIQPNGPFFFEMEPAFQWPDAMGAPFQKRIRP
jgi:hypothetical protein